MGETGTTAKQKSKRVNEAGRDGKPISLAPLSFEEALVDLLQVPPSKVREEEQPKKRATKKTARK